MSKEIKNVIKSIICSLFTIALFIIIIAALYKYTVIMCSILLFIAVAMLFYSFFEDGE